MATTTRGIRKVSENILSHGRAIIVTEKDKDKYKWSEIPVGSKFIDSKTGIEMVKLEGESDWVPAGIKNDGTINVIKDSRVTIEKFIIKQLEVPGTKREFTYYYDGFRDDAHTRHGVILYKNAIGAHGEYNQYGTYPTWTECKKYLLITDDSLESKYKNTQKVGYVFSLETGDYAMYRNHLKVTIDDVLHRSVGSGGVREVSETMFCLTENNLENNMEVTAEYIQAFRLGNPYPRTFVNPSEPEKVAAEVGDFWLDTDGTLADDDPLGDYIEDDGMLDWARIRPKTRPTTLSGYGITDDVSYVGHIHTASDVTGIPDVKVKNAKDADHAVLADNATEAGRINWSGITNKPTSFPPSSHDHNALYPSTDGTRARGTWNINVTGNAKTATTATNANSVPWSGITNKPTTFPPSSHNHDDSYPGITGARATGTWGISITGSAGSAGSVPWSGITGKPSTYAPSAHNHDSAYPGTNGARASGTWGINISGTAAVANSVHWNNVTNKPTTFTPATHNHDGSYPSTAGARATGTWGISITGNAKTATNATNAANATNATNAANATKATNDSAGRNIVNTYATQNDLNTQKARLDGKEFVKNGTANRAISLRYETENGKNVVAPYVDGVKVPLSAQGNRVPASYTPLVDWNKMMSIRTGGEIIKNLRHSGTGIISYGGDSDLSGATRSDIILKESYKNYDAVLICGSNDGADYNWQSLWQTWELAFAFDYSYRFSINHEDPHSHYWHMYGKNRRGTANYTTSTDTHWRCNEQNCGIIEIYGIKYGTGAVAATPTPPNN